MPAMVSGVNRTKGSGAMRNKEVKMIRVEGEVGFSRDEIVA